MLDIRMTDQVQKAADLKGIAFSVDKLIDADKHRRAIHHHKKMIG